MADLMHKYIQQFLIHRQHLLDKFLVKTEMNVVRHDEVILVAHLHAEETEVAEHIFRGCIIGMLGLSGILVYEHLHPMGEPLVTDEFQEGPWRAIAMDRIAQAYDIVTGEVQALIIERIYLIRGHVPSDSL